MQPLAAERVQEDSHMGQQMAWNQIEEERKQKLLVAWLPFVELELLRQHFVELELLRRHFVELLELMIRPHWLLLRIAEPEIGDLLHRIVEQEIGDL